MQDAGYNISAVLDHQLRIGPFNLSLSHLQFSQELQDDLNTLHGITEAFAIMFIIGAGFTGLELVASVLSLYLVPRHERLALILNPALSSLAAFTLVLAGLVATIGAHTTVDKVNGAGADVGLSAAVGVEFEAFVWTGAGLMMVTLAWYLFHLVRFRRGYSIRPAAAAAPAPSRQLSEMDEKHNQPRHVRTGEGAWGKFRESFVSGWSRRT